MDLKGYCDLVDRHRDTILQVERWIWNHPETGYREWETSRYLEDIFRRAGYETKPAGDIPGFTADLSTGRPGPWLLILGEMDALLAPGHPAAVEGRAHACGHNAQCAALVGAALALREPGALDGLCGGVRFAAVPAEEIIEMDFRESLRRQGVIRYLGGKVEFLHRGYFNGTDIAYLFHVGNLQGCTFNCYDSNGCMSKEAEFTGVASHAGAAPEQGVNALYAATLGIQAVQCLRETFRDDDHVRVHPILTEGGRSVNIIPAKARLATFVRGASLASMAQTNAKVNRALAAGALALGAGLTIHDRPGYAPLINEDGLKAVAQEVLEELVGKEQVDFQHAPWGTASTDMGDLSCVMPTIQPHVAGAAGKGHGDDFAIVDPETCCVRTAESYVCLAARLLEREAARAKKVIASAKLRCESKEAYFAMMDQFQSDRELVRYEETGASVNW